jgi:hypothetical protein
VTELSTPRSFVCASRDWLGNAMESGPMRGAIEIPSRSTTTGDTAATANLLGQGRPRRVFYAP